MNTSMIRRGIGSALVAGGLMFAGVLPSYAQEATATTATTAGVPGTTFVVESVGYRADEQASYWINTPNGTIISTEPLESPDRNGNTTTPLLTWADGNGNITINWTVPNNALPGHYSMVIHGIASNHQDVIPFTINPAGSQTVIQTDVTPTSGPVNTVFVFHATGFVGAANIDGEQASYWINTPKGTVIATEPLTSPDKNGNTTAPLIARADSNGVVKIFWTATPDLQPGNYSLVVHGLVSQHQVVIPFSINR
jgi:hypothetical protein